ncbi:MAG: hypothetical protein NXH85_13865 [Pseudomonadaceae bacterium]|nr:hypothetical protein [Pseudomonadaceae bacterium]
MAEANEYFAQQKTDLQLHESLLRLPTTAGTNPDQTTLNLEVATGSNTAFKHTASEALENEVALGVLARNGHYFVRATLAETNRHRLVVDRDESGFDKISVFPGHNCTPEEKTQFIIAVKDEFPPYSRNMALEEALEPSLREYHLYREAELEKLKGIVENLLKDGIALRTALDEEKTAFQEQTANELKKHKTSLDSENEAAVAKLQTRTAELDEREEQLDNRESKHVRREIRKELQQELRSRGEEFNLTNSTRKKRWPVAAAYGLLVLALGAATGVSGWHLLAAPTDVLANIRFVTSLFGFAGSTIFLIRWFDSWFRRHADEEFELKRLQLDLDRASWVVEMAMEWNDSADKELPPELATTLTRGLFTSGEPQQASSHPNEDLASLLLAATGLKLNIPGVGEATFDSKALKKIGDTSENTR